jgi:hypothetical protein
MKLTFSLSLEMRLKFRHKSTAAIFQSNLRNVRLCECERTERVLEVSTGATEARFPKEPLIYTNEIM